MSQTRRALSLLVVEDDPGDQLLIREALAHHALTPSPEVVVVADGEQALSYLNRNADYAGASRPDLVLLDLNLPKCDGRTVLAHIKSDPALRTIPVIVLTTSGLEEDITASYQLHANAYVTKPVDFTGLTATVQHINAFFSRTAHLPGLDLPAA
ncbi:two-component system response regulator [Sphaerisporangium krabiense]|uniref:Two-component system response regulator n=1 Tax=Sphaerisporangium krabiense TaxID=763782 RepID=A0A7W8ZCY8_9ACTN|nr:response regulator [Sphaerisporangium krabiense]MBB5631575.1 two-component system response regulator [Sphaerisporangium krabiense]GII60988.1 two-component system response regulator [Sphaerisporangium krabiense]